MKKTFFAVALAGMCAVGANAACNETVSIGTKAQLDGFRDRVNAGENTLCAVLTADINYATFTLSMSEGTATAPAAANQWKPIVEFSGTFDGQGHSISGLYYAAPKTNGSYYDAGFFAQLVGASVRNLRIVNSYFAADERAGGIVADVKSGNVKIDNVSFSGVITSVTEDNSCLGVATYTRVNGHFGGLIGTVSSGVEKLELLNSYTDALVTANGSCTRSYVSGGIVGSVQGSSTSLDMENCYEAGTVEKVTTVNGKSGSIFGQNNSSGKTTTSNVGCTTKDDSYCKTTSSAGDLEDAFATNIAAQKSATVASLNDPETGAKGVTFSYDSETKKLTATINSAATEFSLPQDVFVDTIKLDREFTPEVYSTIMLPFSVAVGSVAGASEFATFTGVTKNAEGTAYTTVTGSKVTNNLAAYTPYLLETSGTTLTVSGAVTLKANAADTTTSVGNWSFIGTTAKKRWQNQCESDASKCENKDEIGKVYGFSGSEVGDIKVGNFVKVGNKVAIRPMRAYLMYTGSENLPVAKGKPAAPGMAMAAAVESVPTVILPDTLKVIIVDPVVEDPEEDVPTEGPLALDPIKAPAAAFKADRWYDITGRNLNKPKAQGAYINNRTTVIVK